MKCDELKKYKAYEFGGAFVYHINEVDEAIAELKDKLQLDEDEMAGFLQLEEECGGGDLRNYIAELKAENKMLKEHIANGDVSRITWINEATELKAENERLKEKLESVQASAYADSVDAGMRERRLKRALYKACANWALSTLAWLDCIDQGEPKNWSKMIQKCLKKAEEYK